MTNQEIFELIACFDRSTAQTMKLSLEGVSLELTRGQGGVKEVAPLVEMAASAEKPPEGQTVTAPMVGTFYAAPSPEEAPFVKVGDRVAKGQVLCLIEAMKMMSEVPAPCDCVILEVLKGNGELAEFGQPLFRYQPC